MGPKVHGRLSAQLDRQRQVAATATIAALLGQAAG